MINKKITDRPIKIAVVGYGHIAKKHIQAIEAFPNDLLLTGIAEPNSAALEQAVAEHKTTGYRDLSELLSKSNADIVTVCTPSGLHAKQTIAIANHKKHIICEKPMAIRWRDGLDMIKACDDHHVHLFVVKQNRANPTLDILKQAIDLNRFGRIYQININVFWTRPQDYYNQSKWRGSWEFDGGVLMNQASHYIDLLHWLFGPVANVHAMTATQARQIESEDSAVLNLRWRSGTLGSMNVSILTYPKNLEASLTVLGEKGTVKIGGVAINEIETWQFSEPHEMDNQIKTASENTTKSIGDGHIRYYQNVISTLQGHTMPQTDGRDGLKTLELVIAAYMSAREDKTISLPLEF
ncbi:MAG: Gfo/Idh/MocA family oxidoreductase [Gammaproteobacteria bacterium]|nr:Gfo/Idh/MocA family oxidoreductase [Gammaproteobacteria bacterium]